MPTKKLTPESVRAEIDLLKRKIAATLRTPDLERDWHANMELDRMYDQLIAYQVLEQEYDSSGLLQEAVKWGIPATNPEWRIEFIETDRYRIPHSPYELLQRKKNMTWLNETGRSILKKQIRDARFAYWKGWAEIIIPILALLVAIIALVKR